MTLKIIRMASKDRKKEWLVIQDDEGREILKTDWNDDLLAWLNEDTHIEDIKNDWTLNEEQKKEFKPIPVETKAGEAIFHHSLTLHGSGENKSDKPRRAFVINVFADGVVSDSNDELLAGVPPVPKGEKMQGQFFPLLYRA